MPGFWFSGGVAGLRRGILLLEEIQAGVSIGLSGVSQIMNFNVVYPGGATGYMTERKKRVSCTPKKLLDT